MKERCRSGFPFGLTLAVAALLALPGPGCGQQPGPAPPEAPATPPAQAPAAAAEAAGGSDYILQRGDDLEIRAFNNAELNHTVKIRPDGKISLILLDDVQAAGLTPSQLGRQLSESYSKFFRNPRLTVIVRTFTNRAVFVGGEVLTPKLLPMQGRLTLASALFSAGGLKATGKGSEIILLRDAGNGRPSVTRLNLNEVLKKGAPDVELQPFDVVFVPKTRIAKIGQFVDQHIKQLIPVTIGFGFSYLLGQTPLIQ